MDEETICGDVTGRCCAPMPPPKQGGITNCIHCGSELHAINGAWYTHDWMFCKPPLPLGSGFPPDRIMPTGSPEAGLRFSLSQPVKAGGGFNRKGCTECPAAP